MWINTQSSVCLFEGPFVRTFVRMFISKRMHLSVCERTFVCMHLWTSLTKACLHTCIRTYIHTNTCIQTAAPVYTHACTHTRTHARLHTNIEVRGMFILYIHTYIYTNVRLHTDRRTGITFMPRTVFFKKKTKKTEQTQMKCHHSGISSRYSLFANTPNYKKAISRVKTFYFFSRSPPSPIMIIAHIKGQSYLLHN